MVVTSERVASQVQSQGKTGQASNQRCPFKTKLVLLVGFQKT